MSDWLAWLAEPFTHRFMLRAVLICVFLGISASMLGCVLVMRRLSLLGDALAHSLLPGVGIAWLIFGTSLPALFIGGLGAGLATALASGLISRLTRVKEDAAFAALFISLFGVGVALISRVGTPIDLLHVLFGNILGVGGDDLWLAASVSVLTVAVFAIFYRSILLECFDPSYHRACGGRSTLTHLGLLALVVLNLVAALHALGGVLALGLFMLPAVTAYLWCDRWGAMLAFAAIFAVCGAVGGLALSYHAGLASGPAMVAVLGGGFLLSAFLSPRHGLLARGLRPEHHHGEDSDEHCAHDGHGH
jgi:zinc/manganese transport system permease protein